MNPLKDSVRIEDPAFYLDDPLPVFARMRAEAPVFYYEPLDMWVLSKYEDVQHVGRSPLVFTTAEGFHINDFRYGLIISAFFPPDAEVITLLGPPRHDDVRRVVQPSFSPRVMSGLEGRIREICQDLLDKVKPGVPVDWTNAVATPLPAIAIAMLLGMPVEDQDKLLYWSDEIMKVGSARSHEELMEAAGGLGPMRLYFEEHLERIRQNPGDDVVSALLAARDAGTISHETVHMMISGLMTAGNETTRNVLSGGIAALAQRPAEYEKIGQDAQTTKNAAEELLRWVSPVRGFGRTVVEETEVRGQVMHPGQRVFNFFMAANFDEEVFPHSNNLDVSRKFDQTHLAFGFGQHACLGAALARLEIRVLLEELRKRFSTVRLAGKPEMDRKVLFGNHWISVPVIFDAEADHAGAAQ